MSRVLRRVLSGAAVAVVATTLSACTLILPGGTGSPLPVLGPGQPTSGFGSPGTVSAGATVGHAGSTTAGTYVWWYVPTTLLHGTSAPVVILLHGFELQAPQIYQGLIDHLTSEGNIVIYPQFNLGGLTGILQDTDQNAMESRAVAAVYAALAAIGSKADLTDVTLWGHSLGGELATCWMQAGGVPVQAITFADPSVNPGASLPSFLSSVLTITQVPWRSCAASLTVPVMIETAGDDTIAPPAADPTSLYQALTHASSKVLYEAHTDHHGLPVLDANHMAPTQATGALPSFLADLVLDGTGTQDTLDYRYYWAAFDAQLAGQSRAAFAMGAWTDGTPLPAVTQLAP